MQLGKSTEEGSESDPEFKPFWSERLEYMGLFSMGRWWLKGDPIEMCKFIPKKLSIKSA